MKFLDNSRLCGFQPIAVVARIGWLAGWVTLTSVGLSDDTDHSGQESDLALPIRLSLVGWGIQSASSDTSERYNFGQVLNSPESMFLLQPSTPSQPDRSIEGTLRPAFTTDPLTAETVGVACGEFHTLLLKRDGSVEARGWNPAGQTSIPSDLGIVTQIACGADHNLALRADGSIAAWGWNDHEQCNVPYDLKDGVAIAGGGFHSLALLRDGTVRAWGSNLRGQCDVPPDLTDVTAIAAGALHSVALRRDGSVVAWGDNRFYQRKVPDELTNVRAIAAGGYFNLALRHDGTVVAWGDNTAKIRPIPPEVTRVVGIAAGSSHALALLEDQTVVAWGDNSFGSTSVPAGLQHVVAIAGGGFHSQALVQIAPPLLVREPSFITDTLELDLNLPAGRRYRLEKSTDLRNWSEHLESRVTPGRMTLYLPRKSGESSMFYRTTLLSD